MKKYLKVFYWSSAKKKNFGDEISCYLIEKLSGQEVLFRKPTFIGFIHQVLDALFQQKDTKLLIKLISSYRINEKIILGIGSILAISNKQTIAWGAGFMQKDTIIKKGEFNAVRGLLSAQRLSELGLHVPSIYGDPALLLPIVYNPIMKKKDRIGIIPHWSEYNDFLIKYQDKYRIINLNTKDVENTINQILECEYILSSSLHGIIVAQTYGIPAIWIEKKELEKEGFKFKDYFSSVGIKEYKAFKDLDLLLSFQSHIMRLFQENKELSKIPFPLTDIQQKLLSVAPFPILPQYLNH